MFGETNSILEADRSWDDDDSRRIVADVPRVRAVGAGPVAIPDRLGSAYRSSAQHRLPSACAALLVVAALMSALLWLNLAVVQKKTQRMSVFSLALTPPPPAPEPQPRPDHEPVAAVRPQIVAPDPIVPLAPQPVPVATAPEPAPPAPTNAPALAGAAPAPAPAPAPPAIAEGGDLSSKMIAAKPPSYPIESRRRREQGVVVLALTLSPDGRVAEIALARSSGSERLDRAALSAVRGWRWAPMIRDGQPVIVKGEVRIPFVLKA